MIHNIKFPDGSIKAVDCKLGTGVFDRNGKEIFEGDTIRYDNGSSIGEIVIFQATFCVTRVVYGVDCLPSLLEINAIFKDLEIVND